MKKLLNKDVLEKAVAYLEKEFNNYKFDGSLRSKYLKELLTKYIRTVKSIVILDLKGYQKECDIFVRTLDEMIIDITYLELNPIDNYERYDLYANGLIYKTFKDQFDFDQKDISTIEGLEKYKNKYDEYINKYNRFTDRWSGLDYKSQAKKIDEKYTSPVMSYQKLYMKIYKKNLLYSHNSPLILNEDYSKLDINPNVDYLYFHNINYVVILTGMMHFVLPDIFVNEPKFAFEFDNFMAVLNLIEELNKDTE